MVIWRVILDKDASKNGYWSGDQLVRVAKADHVERNGSNLKGLSLSSLYHIDNSDSKMMSRMQ